MYYELHRERGEWCNWVISTLITSGVAALFGDEGSEAGRVGGVSVLVCLSA